ncbi:TolC family protein [Parapedobacter koreensis]|uniref:Outer membrane efflux protein n=1 Tax=Parapedobacter koreensis TaxID=332977 RepID=A0A1H7IP60_9SPHI|nr:TolC family protein [Parapedobacter koreensis]SEK62535.1 Outer membrane efflux protein [Parapedobacter koreensis]
MKKAIFTVLLVSLLVGHQKLSAQESIMGEINYEYLEKLIDLAKKNYPRNQIMKIQGERSKAAVSAAKISYLDLIQASYFYSPAESYLASSSPGTNNVSLILSGFQFGVVLSPGLFFQKPYTVKQAKAQYEVAMLETKNYQTVLEIEVKTRYYNYVLILNDLKVKNQEAQDSKFMLESAREQYELGEIELEDYNMRKGGATQAGLSLAQTEINFLKAKDALEEIIGVKLTDVK